MLGRELLVSVAVLVLAALGARRIDVLWVGKAGTFGLMCCFPLFLLGDEQATWARVLTDVTWVASRPSARASASSPPWPTSRPRAGPFASAARSRGELSR